MIRLLASRFDDVPDVVRVKTRYCKAPGLFLFHDDSSPVVRWTAT